MKSKIKKFNTKYYLPKFKCNTIGNCKIIEFENCIEDGYFSNSWYLKKMFSLLKRKDTNSESWDIWMSLSPSEIESQQIACDLACGHTVVMGLGLGFSALNIAKNINVNKVTVIENDENIIELFNKSIILNDIPKGVMEKISIINSNSLNWKPNCFVDFLYIDIWLELNHPNTLNQVKLMQKNISASKVFFWGQEVLIASKLKNKDIESYNEEIIHSILGIDIALPRDKNYFKQVKKIKYKLNKNKLYNNKYSRNVYV